MPVRVAQRQVALFVVFVNDRVPDEVQILDSILLRNLLLVSSSVALRVSLVDLCYVMERLMDIADIVDYKT